MLTEGADNFSPTAAGANKTTAGNDLIKGDGKTFTALDQIDGGGGVNTLSVIDADGLLNTTIPSGVKITNVQKFEIQTSGNLGAVAAVAQVNTYTVNASPVSSKAVTVNYGTLSQTITSGASATRAEVVDLLAAAINAMAGATVAVNSGGTAVVVTAPVAGTALPLITFSGATDPTMAPTTTFTTPNQTGAVATAAYDVSGIASLTDVSVSTVKSMDLKAADTQNVNVTGATGNIAINGGKNIVVNDDTTGTDITIGATTVNAGTITVTDTKVGAANIAVDGGTDVTITATGSTGAGKLITVGAGPAATDLPTGAVVIDSTGAKYVVGTVSALNAITVKGGKTISVTQHASSDNSAAAKDAGAADHTQGKVTITAAATTTDVTVKQDAEVTGKNAAATSGGATETASVKFVDLAAGNTVIINGLTLTATPAIDGGTGMTAAQVAAAFANLTAGATTPATVAGVKANGDTQSAAAAAKATYSGSLKGWTSGAATGDTVVFTFGTANAPVGGDALAVTGSGIITPTILTTGKALDAATAAGGVMGIKVGVVDITGDVALKTVTVDGYATGSKIQDATTNTALDTITLANGADMTIDSAAATVALSATNAGTVDIKAGTTTLNATVNGGSTTLKSATVTTLNVVAGNGFVAGTAAAANLAVATAINTTGFMGMAEFTLDGTKTTYTGGAGVDKVTLSNTTTAATDKAIDLGAGNDTLVIADGTTSKPTVVIKGGLGEDTLQMKAADATTFSADTAFGAQFDSFERLSLTGATGTQGIDLGKLGFTNHVTVAGVAANGTLTLNDLANNGTVVLTAGTGTGGVTVAMKDAATNLADVLNVTLSSAGILAAGTLTATKVETIKLTATDTNSTAHVDTLTLAADTATSLTIDGNAGLTLTLDALTTKLATIDAGGMTAGGLNVAANGAVAMTITGGKGADVLYASIGATAKADIINGGDGNDTIYAGSNGAKLTGGAGNDLFVLGNAAGTAGTKAANTYSTITDFGVGDDVLQLLAYQTAATAGPLVAKSFTSFAANVQDPLGPESYIDAVMEQLVAKATLGTAVWFMHGSDTYIVVDSGAAATVGGVFAPNDDLIIKLAGVNGENLSFNDTFGTVSL